MKRIVSILESVIEISEKKGTGGVQPHNAILKGELLDRIIIRYMVKNKTSYYGGTKLDRTVVVKLFTSATVWEFKKEVSQMLGLSPKYIKLALPNKKVLHDNMHGMTLQQLAFKNNDVLTAQKTSVSEVVSEVPLVDAAARELVPRVKQIFTEWYEMYKNKETGLMDRPSVARFIFGATGSPCAKEDSRVTTILNKYDSDKDEAITLAEFLRFYYDAAHGTGLKNVQLNLKMHNVRLDLKKISEVVDEVSFAEHEMPRHTMSANQVQFQTLLQLLDRNDDASQNVWDLVRMLATNQKMYREVLSFSESQSDAGINWASVFED